MENIKDGEKVLLIWSGLSPPQDLQQIVSRMSQLVGSSGKVNVEHVDRLKLCKLPGRICCNFLFANPYEILYNVRFNSL